ncbi:hypothetical protein SG34_030480 [Thalassomonas viridans]|uniref:Uncharacterized protein n=1 Tax=Thalassomonas viridans TaxID=137584 RepID=A0AAE9ZEK9_9GAMM|nr:hypothetical protein [Thalassomonas viridans]WDE09098.1 hypothetical protein SG34_030480 [Thalassomonas viridans]
MSLMKNQGCFFHQGSGAEQELQGLTANQCFLLGYLSNERQLYQQLNIENGDQQALLNAAVSHWGREANRHLFGDYLLIWLTDEQLMVTSSARASFTLFYTRDKDQLALATDLKLLTEMVQAGLNQSYLLQLLALGQLAAKDTSFEQISRLQAGETLIWQLEKEIALTHESRLSDTEQLELVQLFALPPGEALAPRTVDDVNETGLFNQLPSLAYRLGEPVVDAALAHFDSLVHASSSDTLVLDISWLNARNTVAEQANNKIWCKSILKRPLLAQRKVLQQCQQQLASAFKAAQDEHSEFLTFSQWLDLHYVIPAWCQLLQRICRLHGKTLINPYMQPGHLMPVVKQAVKPSSAYFSLQQISLANVYDAMQRLFYTGEAGTRELFDLNPMDTAGLLRKTERRRVEQLAVLVLTLDYLVRFEPGGVAGKG